MPVDRCQCGNQVDIDEDAEAYEYGECLCIGCRNRRADEVRLADEIEGRIEMEWEERVCQN